MTIQILIPTGFGRVDGLQALDELRKAAEAPKPTPSIITTNSSRFIIDGELEFNLNYLDTKRTWAETHFILQNQGWRMPTPYEFVSFIYHLKRDRSPSSRKVLERLFKVNQSQSPGFWLDAKFEKIYGNSHMLTNHTVQKVAGPTSFRLGMCKSYILNPRYDLAQPLALTMNLDAIDAQGFPLSASPGSGDKYSQVVFEEPFDGRVAAFLNPPVSKMYIAHYSFNCKENELRSVYACRDVKP